MYISALIYIEDFFTHPYFSQEGVGLQIWVFIPAGELPSLRGLRRAPFELPPLKRWAIPGMSLAGRKIHTCKGGVGVGSSKGSNHSGIQYNTFFTHT